MNQEYRRWRKQIYDPLKEEGLFTWDSIPGEEYALATMHSITPDFRSEIASATEELGALFYKVMRVIQNGSDDLLQELGLPKNTWNAVKLYLQTQAPTVIGRFDFAMTPQGLKMLEFNSDTPTSIVEAYYVNEHVCKMYKCHNPNAGMDKDIGPAFQNAVHMYEQEGYPCESIYFSSLEWHQEDKGTTIYLLQQSGLPSSFVPLKDLAVQGNRLFAYNSLENAYTPIDVLYRLHGLELFVEDKDEDGYPTGNHILELVAQKKLAIINPPSAFILQSKALQALIWNVYVSKSFFDAEERELIASYMLPTYLDNPFQGKTSYVEKPIFGREGDSVTIYDKHGNPVAFNQEKAYRNQMMIYQEKVDLGTVRVPTLKGEVEGKLLWGSFLLDGKASAIVARVDEEITGDMAFYLPVGMV